MTEDREFEETLRGTMHDLFPESKKPLLLRRIHNQLARRRRRRRLATGGAAAALVAVAAFALPIALDDGSNTSTPGRHQSANMGSGGLCGDFIHFQGRDYAGARIASLDHPGKVGKIPATQLRPVGTGKRHCGDRLFTPHPVMSIDGINPTQAVVFQGELYTAQRQERVRVIKNLAQQPWIHWVPEPTG